MSESVALANLAFVGTTMPLRLWYNLAEMAATAAEDLKRVIGRSPDRLTLEERLLLAGKFVALEIYTPETLPLVQIEAIGDSLADCVRMLKSRGLDPARYEFRLLPRPY